MRLALGAVLLVGSVANLASASGLEGLMNYFEAGLRGVRTEAPQQALKPGEVEAAADSVWVLWRRANERFAEQELTAGGGVWPLPDGAMEYLFVRKGGEAPEQGLPLFLFLHGSGPNDYEYSVGASWCRRFDDGPSVYFIPRSPLGGSGCRWFQPSRQQAWERLLRRALLTDSIDADRIYILGISEGGYGTQRLASFYPDYLAGAGPIAGGEPTYNCEPANTANLAYCQQTGELDSMFGRSRIVARAQAEWDSLAAARPGLYVHKIDLQPGRGHGCDYTVVTPWLKEHRRNPRPGYFYWERHAIGNVNGEGARARRGVYNLIVEEGQNGATDGLRRDAYEMTIEGNTIDLRILDVEVEPSCPVTENGWTINTGAERRVRPAERGRVRIYLDNELVDLSKPVTVNVNGRRCFRGKIGSDIRNMAESVMEFHDPRRIFPAALTVEL